MNSIGREFMRLTRHRNLSPSPQSQGLPIPPLTWPSSPGATWIALPAPGELEPPAIDLRVAIEQRRSRRSYADLPVTLEELSYLLWVTQGVQAVIQRPATRRTVPSAGARHALETFLLVRRVEGLAAGLYRFAPLEHALVEVDLSPDVIERGVHACWDQRAVRQAAVVFLWVAVLERMAWRYSERSYRYLHLDAGHVCQNLYLAAEAIGCGACAIGGFDDDQLNQVVGVDGEAQFTVYAATVGKKVEKSSL